MRSARSGPLVERTEGECRSAKQARSATKTANFVLRSLRAEAPGEFETRSYFFMDRSIA